MFLDLLQELAGDYKETSTHERYCCPLCGENKYKFYVESEEPHRWICFKCGLSGNPISLVREYYGISFLESKEVLMSYDYDIDNLDVSKFNREYHDQGLTDSERILLAINDLQKKPSITDNVEVQEQELFMPTLPTNVRFFAYVVGTELEWEAKPFLEYLYSRGVTNEEIIKHGMGYVKHGTVDMPNGSQLTLRNHVLFITYDGLGNPMYWNTRAIESDSYIKSFNAPSRDHEYGKHNALFNFNVARNTDKVIINEGVFDALTCGESGIATFGSQITDTQVNLLKSALRTNPNISYYVFLDRDAYDKGDKLAKKLAEATDKVYLVLNTTDEDANQLGKEKVQKLVENALPYNDANSIMYLLYKT